MSLEQTQNASELLEVARKAAFETVVHDSDGVKFTKVGKGRVSQKLSAAEGLVLASKNIIDEAILKSE